MPQPSQPTRTIWQDLELAYWLAQYPALTVITVLRFDVGYRLLSPIALFAMLFVMMFLATHGHALARPQDLEYFALVSFASGVTQRFLRWLKIGEGNRQHSYYVGTSIFDKPNMPQFLRNKRRVERFIDPLVCILLGAVFADISPTLAVWLAFSGLSLRLFEYDVYRRHLNRRLDVTDGLVEGKIQTENVEEFTNSSPQPRPQTDDPGVPTGVGPDIEHKILKSRSTKRPIL